MHKIIIIISIILSTVQSGLGQNLAVDSLQSEFDKVYGLDILLNNGRKYFPENDLIIGHPFFRSSTPLDGEVLVGNKLFRQQKLRYDINKQELILVYTNYNNQENQIILNSDGIDFFVLEKDTFIYNTFSEIPQKFTQLIYQGEVGCYLGWSKELQFNSTGSKVGHQFVDKKCAFYLVYNGVVHPFKNKKTFLNIFIGEQRNLIRRFISSNNIKFSNMSTDQLKRLVVFCDNL